MKPIGLGGVVYPTSSFGALLRSLSNVGRTARRTSILLIVSGRRAKNYLPRFHSNCAAELSEGRASFSAFADRSGRCLAQHQCPQR
jgi:hypothetical protein